MLNKICGFAAIVTLTLFIGGLAYSIWKNTDSNAFPVIVGIVLVMAYRSYYDEVKSPRRTEQQHGDIRAWQSD